MLDQVCAEYWFTEFMMNSKFHGHVSAWTIGKWSIIAVKPQTYMNKSGTSVASIAQYYGISPNDICVFQDDIDMEFWKIKSPDMT